MGGCGFYLVQIGLDGEPVYDPAGQPVRLDPFYPLPVQSRLGVEYGFERQDILFETELGRRYVFPQYTRQIRKMTFRVNSSTQLVGFYYLDQAVGGQRDPFIFVPDVDNPVTTFFCRKESSFIVKQLETVAFGAMVDYQMTLSEEPTGLLISG